MGRAARRTQPVRVAAANDYQLIVDGVAAMLSQFPEQVEVCDRVVAGEMIENGPIDVVLYDTYGRIGLAEDILSQLIGSAAVRHVAVFSFWFPDDLVVNARNAGVTGFISKALPAAEIRDAVVAVASGEEVMAIEGRTGSVPGELNWPGRDEGVSERESQVLVLAAEGLTNREIGEALYLSAETVKSHLRQARHKLGLRNRVEAAAYVARSGAFSRYQPAAPDTDGELPAPTTGPPARGPARPSAAGR